MLKFMTAMFLILIFIAGGILLSFNAHFFINFQANAEIEIPFYADSTMIHRMLQDGQSKEFLLRGVEVSNSLPGRIGLRTGASYEDFLRWFTYISEMGANSIYIPTIMYSGFYNAFYDFNQDNENPLFLLHGISGHDYDSLSSELKQAIDIIHGNRINILGGEGLDFYFSNISEWVIGFVIGNEWNPDEVVFMNHFMDLPDEFQGEFFATSEDATPFEVMLAEVMETGASYETRRFNTQRPIGIFSDPNVDFLEYQRVYASQLRKYVTVNPENVIAQDAMVAGMFAAYQLFYVPEDFDLRITDEQQQQLYPILRDLDRSCLFYGYLDLLIQYHNMPVIAVGFGATTSRATEVHQLAPLTEIRQGQGIANMSMQMEERGWAGGFISLWQDQWQRRAWNTVFAIDPWNYKYWHNLQSVAQWNGLMAFDPGQYRRNVLVDGLDDEWHEAHLVYDYDNVRIYVQYDELGLYLLIRGEKINVRNKIYIPIDVTPNSGTRKHGEVYFDRPADFLLILNGTNNTELLIDRRYDVMYQRFLYELAGENPFVDIPDRWDSGFEPLMIAVYNRTLVDADVFNRITPEEQYLLRLQTWNAGRLRHGNGDPDSNHFDSLSDFHFGENLVEIRIPWALLNFYDPSTMRIHDDYFDNFGVRGKSIEEIYIGINSFPMTPIPLEGWGRNLEFHERLKQSYFIIQELWNE